MKYFGTDGIRGVFGKELSEELAFKAGLAASRIMGDECFVGRDTRTSGDVLVCALSDGLMHGGVNVKYVGIVPTPTVSFLSRKYHSGGIVISASHNPPAYNGIKFFSPKGYKLTATAESAIEEYIDRPPAHIGGGKLLSYASGREEYIDDLVEGVNLEGREITLDCAFGAASTVAKEVFEKCGAKVKAFNCEADGTKINCGVGALFPSFISEKAEGKLGFAFDGDADRLVVTDGSPLDGDSVLYNLALILSPSGVVGTIMNNRALETELGKLNIPFVRTNVGDKHIGEAMRRRSFPLGGEQSGHYIISPAVSGDALKAALTLCGRKELRRLALVPQREASIEATANIMYDARFVRAKEECEKILRGGRLVVRMSGTEPKIRLMAESEDGALAEKAIDILTEAIRSLNIKEN